MTLLGLAAVGAEGLVRTTAVKELVQLLLADAGSAGSADAQNGAESAARALALAREEAARTPTDGDLPLLAAEALYRLGRFAEIPPLLAANAAPGPAGKREALLLLAALRGSLPPAAGGAQGADAAAAAATTFFLDGAIAEAHRWAYRELRDYVPESLSPALTALVEGRLSLLDRSYGAALRNFRRGAGNTGEAFFDHPELLPDYGKALQYAGTAAEGSALFQDWEKRLRERPGAATRELRFRLLFYSGRMERQADRPAAALALFNQALPLAPDAAQGDACVWYILDLSLTLNPADAVDLVRRYLPVWSSPAYFADYLDKLCGKLVAQKRWDDLAEIFRLIQGVADGPTRARYAYVVGRATHEGYLKTRRPMSQAEAARGLFRIAFEADAASFYYRSLAASYLGESVALVPDGTENGISAQEPAPSEEARFLRGFFAYGAAASALPYAQALADGLPVAELRRTTDALARAGRHGDAVRLASRLLYRPNHVPDRRDLTLLYPQPFKETIEAAAEEQSLPREVFFGLIRTESAFIPDVVSRSGAVGLAQLMPATARDVADRLARAGGADYRIGGTIDLRDPAINVKLGAWYLRYLENLVGTPMLALASYNGGLTRVRAWRRAQPDLPEDLFLETIDIAETREYGRKVLAAAAVYGYLYYGMTMEAVVADIFPR